MDAEYRYRRKLEETKRVSRILTILEYLSFPKGRRARRRELAEKFEVSERQITNDLQVIRHGLGIELSRDARGYYLKVVPKLPSAPFDFRDAINLVISLKAALDTGLVDANRLQSAIERLLDLFPENLRSFLKRELSRKPVRTSAEAVEHLEQLVQAIEGRRRIRISYLVASRGGQLIEREIDPYSIILYRNNWELVAYCHLRQDVRIFNVSRIQRLEVLDQQFDSIKCDPRELLANSWGVVRTAAGPSDVSLLFDPQVAEYIKGQRWHESQKVQQLPNGSVRLELQVSLTADFIGWVLSFGPLVKVEGPPQLREQVISRANEVLRLYQVPQSDRVLLQEHRGTMVSTVESLPRE